VLRENVYIECLKESPMATPTFIIKSLLAHKGWLIKNDREISPTRRHL